MWNKRTSGEWGNRREGDRERNIIEKRKTKKMETIKEEII